MNFWTFRTTGIGGMEEPRHRRFIYISAIVSCLAVALFGGLAGWITGGNILWVAASIAMTLLAVYLISYVLFVKGQTKATPRT